MTDDRDWMTHEEFLEWSAKEHGWSIKREIEWQAEKEKQYQTVKAIRKSVAKRSQS